MSSISSYDANFQAQPPDLTTQLRARISTLENENRQLKQQLLWEDKLFANPNLSPSHKLALRAAVNTVRKVDHPKPDLTKIYIPKLADQTGLSPKTVGKNLQYLADTGALIREAETETDQNGQKITRVYIGLTDQIKKPDTIQPPKPRNHGGLRSYCSSCGSENLLEEKKIICTDCGTVISKTQRLVNPDDPTDRQDDCRSSEEETTPPTDNHSSYKNQEEPMDNLTAGLEKPVTPPQEVLGGPGCPTTHEMELSSKIHPPITPPGIITSQIPMSKEQDRVVMAQEKARSTERDLVQAARLLLDIAGDSREHISMPGEQGKKYTTIHKPLTLQDMQAHLKGTKTLGATLQYQDGTTRALCFDTDDNPTDSVTWSELQSSAEYLYAEGYKPLLEPSPAGRGGHLWLIFSDRVNARAAYNTITTLAPALKDVDEYWPGRGNKKVRLPAGKYVTPTFSEWTHLVDADHTELSKTGAEAAHILLTHLTPADLIPDIAPVYEQETERSEKREIKKLAREAMTKEPDEKHKSKYGEHSMWVEWPDEQYLIDRYNATHSIDELATFDRSGMINAGQIGRPERTASVGVTPDGERFTDFGAGARQPDGTQEGGDPFEFYVRSQQREKSDVLRELGQVFNREASRELLCKARAGEVPPVWVMEIITDKGREIYNENARAHGHPTLEEHEDTRGVGGFSPQEIKDLVVLGPETARVYEGDYLPPSRPCLHCQVTAWKWVDGKYICQSPKHPPE